MSLAPIVAAAPKTAAASPRHSSRMRGAAAAAPRTSLRPCGRVRPRAERLPARSAQRDQEGPLLEPYSSYPSRASRGTLVRPVEGIKKNRSMPDHGPLLRPVTGPSARERAVAGRGGGARRAAGPLGARGGALGMGRGEGVEYASSAHGGARRGRPGVRVIGTLSCTKEP